jgi:hypothetical protein
MKVIVVSPNERLDFRLLQQIWEDDSKLEVKT